MNHRPFRVEPRFFFGVAVLTCGAAIFAACAQGGSVDTTPADDLTSDVDAGQTTPHDGGTVLPPQPCDGACRSIESCIDGKCVVHDEDHDTYGADVDCNDKDPSIHPGATEVCNGKDDDCNGIVDDGFDKDKDTYSTCATSPESSKDAGADGGSAPLDCDDSDPAIHPGATEVCNGKDDDCNGIVDDVIGAPVSFDVPLDTPLDPKWKLGGDATAANGWVQLTPAANSKSGALWWDSVVVMSAFDMTATFKIPAKSGYSADGLGFAWIEGNTFYQTGKGSDFGVKGGKGYVVVIDTYQNSFTDPNVPYVDVRDATTMSSVTAGKTISGLNDGNPHTLHVVLSDGKVSVDVDGANVFKNAVLPNPTPLKGHWGFGAATGAYNEENYVKDVSMTFPNGVGCVP